MSEDVAGLRFGQFLTGLGGLLVIAGFGLLAIHGLLWLRDGAWTPIALRTLPVWLAGSGPWADPDLTWLGVKRIVAFILDVPLFGALWLAGLAIWTIGSGQVDRAEARQRALASRRQP